LESALDGALHFQLFFFFYIYDQVLKTNENSDVVFEVGDGDARACNSFGAWLLSTFKVMSLTNHKASPDFAKCNADKCIRNRK
jgi:hypothetical protein